MKVAIIKVHGSGNDFFLIDERQLDHKLTEKEINLLRISLCYKKSGLINGADGLLLVQESVKKKTLAKMRVINRDGSDASMCGNGLRTVARYIAEKEHVTEGKIETKYADLRVSEAVALGTGIHTYKVEISPVSFDPQLIPMNTQRTRLLGTIIPVLSPTIRFSVVAVPNPHLIAFVEQGEFDRETFERIATYVNGENPLFPDGINVSFVERVSSKNRFVRTFERGVGLTNACGTAMCASSLVYVLLQETGLSDKELTIVNPGGMVKTVVHEQPKGNYWMELIGNATFTHHIEGTLQDLCEAKFEAVTIRETAEQEKYLEFIAKVTNERSIL